MSDGAREDRPSEIARTIWREPFTRADVVGTLFLVHRRAAGRPRPRLRRRSPWAPAWSWPSPSSGWASSPLSVRGARGIGGFHRQLARGLLDEQIEEPEPFAPRPGFLGWLQSAFRDRTGWRSMAYMVAQGPLAVLGILVGFACGGTPSSASPTRCGEGREQPGRLRAAAAHLSDRGSSPAARRLLPRAGGLPRRRICSSLPRRGPCGPSSTSTAASCGSCSPPSPDGAGALAGAGPGADRRLLGGHLAADRARSARRHPGPTGGPGHAPRDGQGEAGRQDRPRSPSISIRSASWSTTPTGVPRRPSSNCGTWPAASIPPPSTSASEGRCPPWRRAAPSRPRSPLSLDDRPTPAIEAIAYFCVAELLANVAQHAHASRASITCTEHGQWLRLVVRDDGTGGAQLSASGPPRAGWSGLTDRVHAVDGRLDIVSPPGGPRWSPWTCRCTPR